MLIYNPKMIFYLYYYCEVDYGEEDYGEESMLLDVFLFMYDFIPKPIPVDLDL